MLATQSKTFITKLASRLSLTYLLISLSALAAVAGYAYQSGRKNWQDGVRNAVYSISPQLQSALQVSDSTSVRNLAEQLFDTPGIAELQIHRGNTPLVQFNNPAVAKPVDGSSQLLIAIDNSIIHIQPPAGYLWRSYQQQALFPLILTISLLAICIALHYIHWRFVTINPLSNLLKRTRKLNFDRTEAKLLPLGEHPDTPIEIDELAAFINQCMMTVSEEQQKRSRIEQELKRYKRNLGSLVQARTAELVELNKRFVAQQFDAKTSALEAKQARWDAEKANQDKTRFLAAASHDLRQPLHAMSLFIEALEPLLETQKSKEIHFNLKRSLETMKELFNALLDISKLEAGVMQPKIEDFSAQRMFDHLEVVFRQQAIEKDLDLRIVPSKRILRSDPHLLEQVLYNLISNAIKHTTSGYIFVGCRQAGQHNRLLVWDSGPGIPKQEHDSIFKEFVQLNNPERDRSKGLGLGLSIVKRTCELLKHPINFRSEVGVGTRFEIVTPKGEALPKRQTRMRPGQTSVEKTSRVLVIDDDAAILLGMKALLESWKLKPILARSIEDAERVSRLSPLKPDLIISDLRLREGVTGIQAIQHMHHLFQSNIPSVLITGDTSPERIKMAFDSPFPLLHKPIKPAQLRSVCNSILNFPAS